MNIWNRSPDVRLTSALLYAMLFMSSVVSKGAYAEPIKQSTPQETLQMGERIYRDGVLPSGKPMMAYVKADLPVSGTAFSCVSCHMRSGLGSFEGNVFTPPTNGAKLFQPSRTLHKGREQKIFPLPDRRPAYTDASLAEAIRSGTSPTGGTLNDVMPRYMLEDEDMSILVSYLKSLSAQVSPGVSDTVLRFATIITEDVPSEKRDAMLRPLERYVNLKNDQSKAFKARQGVKSRQMAENMLVSKELATRNLTLSHWILKGPPETWRTQLEDYYNKEPVFAFLGGISTSEWSPIHQFCEENHIPCLLPSTDFPVISEKDWYTLYPSKGFFQEGEAAARYLNSGNTSQFAKPPLQIVRDSKEGKSLSSGFEQTWLEIGRPSPVTIRLSAGEKLTEKILHQILEKYKPAAILFWDGFEVLSVLKMMADIKNKPEKVIVSSRYLGESFKAIPEDARDFTYITYPFAFALKAIKTSMGSTIVPDDSKISIKLESVPSSEETVRISALSNTITQLATMSLMDMGGNYYRDYFLDVISMLADQSSTVFGRFSFGPGQRYASKGCYIVQLTKGPDPEMLRKSDWVIH